ncbi:MAG TPA: hypothetical protein VNB03_03810, partial [Casimicrobiaceae bacterium]|nr:hypothetical protein [Casimicrobiaceae bacterium]
MNQQDQAGGAAAGGAADGAPTYEDVEAAAARLAGVAHRTPVVTSATADRRLGASLFFKCENLQRVGAFKFRGASNGIRIVVGTDRRLPARA